MSEYKIGTVINMNEQNYIILHNLKKDENEYLIVVPARNIEEKWEDIKDPNDVKVDYTKTAILTHNITQDSFEFEKNETVLKEVYSEIIQIS